MESLELRGADARSEMLVAMGALAFPQLDANDFGAPAIHFWEADIRRAEPSCGTKNTAN
jgi:hypothetical protein